MNKQKFIEYLRKPVDLNEQTLEELEQLIAEYPYFQSARTLLAKGSKINKSKKASMYVNSAAIYATDRVLLKRYINDELIFLNPLQVHESHEADHERDLGKVIKTNRQVTTKQKIQERQPKKASPSPSVISKKVKKQPPAEPKGTKKKEEKPEVVEKPSNLDHIIEELYRDMEELKINREKFRQIENKLEEDEAVDNALKKATIKANKQEQEEEQKTQTPEKEELPKKPAESKPTTKVDKIDSSGKKKEKKKKTPSSKAPKKTVAKPPKSKKATDKDTPAESTGKEKRGEGKKEADSPHSERKNKSAQENIIANFIKNNPSISPADGKTKTDEDLSGDSTVLHPDLASEYLAEIYLEQGKKEIAKKIYGNLMVKYPEKSVYFADIIKKLN